MDWWTNPEVITSGQWDRITTALFWLWAFVASVVVFAASLLTSHGLIPSLVSTHDLSPRFQSLRPVFYGIAALALAAAIVCLVLFIVNLQVIYEIYPRVWI